MSKSEPTTTVTVTVNGEEYVKETEDRKLLVHFLREDLGLTGTHQGCVVGKCGACTVLHDGTPKKSCMLYAAQIDGDEITTVEGLADIAEAEGNEMETRDGATLHPLQMGFKRNHGLQCGFCTPGFLMTSYALLQENEDPDDDEIRSALSGNICRCTGYNSIVESVEWAAAELAGADDGAGGSDGNEDGAVSTDGGFSTDGAAGGCPCRRDYPTGGDGE
ncbi:MULTISPECIES: (2Fe-2S)-binding protein [Halorussus]|uniref:(2Fe-2S)-binding protein n=1 Tax=Halorussus TaxID=1070314 RepID=UPI0020A1CD91|nr:(2Fe-2S)-binding protein [Halorussus vallis]USZ77881.1 (2Fe-2S)-binding protein [Halorussus vallis]